MKWGTRKRWPPPSVRRPPTDLLNRLWYFLQVFTAFVPPGTSPIPWVILIAVALVTIGPALHADDPPTGPSKDLHNYKTVQIKGDGAPMSVRVQEQPDPLRHVTMKDDLDHQRAFSETNEMANKSFTTTAGPAWIHNADVKGQDSFATKPYDFNDAAPTVPNVGTKATFRSTPFKGSATTGFDKSFPTTAADASQNQAAVLGASASPDQGRAAPFNARPVHVFAAANTEKTFQGEEADAAHRRLKRLNDGSYEISDLPDRPLTIDEVRNLINHGFKPNTSQPPPEPTRPMNDPDYVAQPLRDDPSPPSSTPPAKARDDDKDDAVPPPGTMATPPPENSESLPKR
jgi:hypothetical protein